MSDILGKAERKYLAAHAESEVQFAAGLSATPQRYGHVLVIPASGEGPELARTLSSVPGGPLGSALTILVVNATPDAPAPVHEANARTLSRLAHDAEPLQVLAPNATLFAHESGDRLVLDRSTYGYQLPKGQGVGLARKIGTDLALALLLSGRVDSRWIHVSDADVVFPADYFHQVVPGQDAGTSARLYRFRHVPGDDPRSYEAALQYEVTLRYYVLGLRFAGSPYAFHSIGSTLALEAGAYAQVRGFPRRTAAEDFYLLNKLAKVGRIESLRGSPLQLSSRVSHRVPFGTGAAIARMLEAKDPEIATYHPALFHHLRAWLGAQEEALAQSRGEDGSNSSLSDRVREHSERDLLVDSDRLLDALEHTGALAAAAGALEAPARAIRGRLHDAFDGFRSLKLLHALRDAGLPDQPLREALEGAEFLSFPEAPGGMSTSELASCIEELDSEAPDRPDTASLAKTTGS